MSDLADGIVKLCDCETKGYDYDENGQSLGAAWYNEWITANGKVVRRAGLDQEGDLESNVIRQMIAILIRKSSET